MRTAFAVLLFATAALAQVGTNTQAHPLAPPPAGVTTAAPATPAADPVLLQLTQVAQATNADIARLRIDRWKTDGSSKQQAQTNADALQRNLQQALPGLVLAAQSAPADVAPKFKLYRNVDALYSVLGMLAQAASAFSKDDAEARALAHDAQQLDTLRHQLADRLETMTTERDSEMARLRAAAQRAASAAAQPPKKIVIDDNESPKKPARKKVVKKKPAAPAESTSTPK
jgi:hypothetical protein